MQQKDDLIFWIREGDSRFQGLYVHMDLYIMMMMWADYDFALQAYKLLKLARSG
jgi:hypothetical protein